MTPHARLASIVLTAAALAAGGCSFNFGAAPPPAASRADPTRLADLDACRTRADQIFTRQNRDHVYRVDAYNTDTRDAPFGTSGLKGVTSAGLSQQFDRDNLVENCLRGSGAAAAPMSRDLHSNGPVTP